MDWRQQVPEARRRIMRRWLWCVAVITLGVLVVGGATRLTHSGLSMVQWQPILGVIPPLSHADWQQRFQQYQQFPEFQKMTHGMTLSQFKVIFYWEYTHRLLARSIGVVFLIPFIFFLLRGWMNRQLAWRAAALFGLGVMQGVMGWLMVASGLVDRPSVSHYRLAAHLSLAFMIFGYAIWLARDLAPESVNDAAPSEQRKTLRMWLTVIGALLCTQVVYGAFVAGLKAGFFDNTFPLMAGRWVPERIMLFQPWFSNLVSNPITVQWLHRLIGTLLLLTIIAFAARTRWRFALMLLAAVVVQYTLGVLTLINAVPIPLGVTHQAMAMILFGVWVSALHSVRKLENDTEGNEHGVAEYDQQRRAHV